MRDGGGKKNLLGISEILGAECKVHDIEET